MGPSITWIDSLTMSFSAPEENMESIQAINMLARPGTNLLGASIYRSLDCGERANGNEFHQHERARKR